MDRSFLKSLGGACFLAAPVLALALLACAPQTRFRRAALVPMPTGDALTQPQEGLVEVSGSVTHQDVRTDLVPEVGDSALNAATTTFSGGARFRLGRYFRLGASAFYGRASLSTPTAVGTPNQDGEHLIGGGPNVSFNYRTARWAVGGGIDTAIIRVPWGTWRRTSQDDAPWDEVTYENVETDTDVMIRVTMAAGATYIPSEYVEIFGGISLQNSFENIGFDDVEREGSTLSAGNFGVVPFAGATLRIPGGAFIRAQYFVPIGFSQFNAGGQNFGGFTATVGWAGGGRQAETKPY